jgi:hypothetical protein
VIDSPQEGARELCLMLDALFPGASRHRLVLNKAWVDNWRQSPDTFEPAFDYALEHGWIAAIYPYRNYQLTEKGLAVARA